MYIPNESRISLNKRYFDGELLLARSETGNSRVEDNANLCSLNDPYVIDVDCQFYSIRNVSSDIPNDFPETQLCSIDWTYYSSLDFDTLGIQEKRSSDNYHSHRCTKRTNSEHTSEYKLYAAPIMRFGHLVKWRQRKNAEIAFFSSERYDNASTLITIILRSLTIKITLSADVEGFLLRMQLYYRTRNALSNWTKSHQDWYSKDEMLVGEFLSVAMKRGGAENVLRTILNYV